MKDREKKLNELNMYLDGRVQADVDLKNYSTFKIGGEASMFFIANNNDDLVRIITYAKKLKIPFVVLSGGSNILINDKGVDKLVVIIKSKDIQIDKNFIIADSGVLLSDVVKKSIDNNLDGLIWASGIPGSVGGAVRGNAGAYGWEMKSSVHSVEILRGSKQFILNNDQLGFGYRDSIFKHNSDIILIVKFKLKGGIKSEILKSKSDILITERCSKHPKSPCAGSFFKNILIDHTNEKLFRKLELPEKYFEFGKAPVGWILDKLNMRGFQIGDAKISDQHSNMIINNGNATADQVIQLSTTIKTKISDEFGIKLEEEVELIGF